MRPRVPGAAALFSLNDGAIDPAKDTIVFTHGWQPKGTNPDELWTCVGGTVPVVGDFMQGGACLNRRSVGSALAASQGIGSANVLQFVWSDANTASGIPNRSDYLAARDPRFCGGRDSRRALVAGIGARFRKICFNS